MSQLETEIRMNWPFTFGTTFEKAVFAQIQDMGSYASPIDELQMKPTYFDTPDRILHQNQMSCRIRNENENAAWIETIKIPAEPVGGVETVREFNRALRLGSPHIPENPQMPEPVATLIGDTPLEPVGRVIFTRQVLQMLYHGTWVSVAYDRGVIYNDGIGLQNRCIPFTDLGLTLMEGGDPNRLIELSEQMQARLGCQSGAPSKVVRLFSIDPKQNTLTQESDAS